MLDITHPLRCLGYITSDFSGGVHDLRPGVPGKLPEPWGRLRVHFRHQHPKLAGILPAHVSGLLCTGERYHTDLERSSRWLICVAHLCLKGNIFILTNGNVSFWLFHHRLHEIFFKIIPVKVTLYISESRSDIQWALGNICKMSSSGVDLHQNRIKDNSLSNTELAVP